MQRRHLWGGTLAAVGLVLAGIQVIHAVRIAGGPVAAAVDALPMVAVALALAFTGLWLARRPGYEADLPRIVAWCAGGTVVFLSLAALTLFSQRLVADEFLRAAALAVDNVTVGATSGALVGCYDARSRRRLRSLERERDRIEAFGGKAADVNNYGRAIARCDAVSGVAAFCIEAVATLLDVRHSAVLELSGDAMRVVGNTTEADRETLRALAEAALDQEVGAVEVRESVSGDGVGADTVLSALVSDHPDASVVMITLIENGEPVTEADRELLGLLLSHARMAIERIDGDHQQTGAI